MSYGTLTVRVIVVSRDTLGNKVVKTRVVFSGFHTSQDNAQMLYNDFKKDNPHLSTTAEFQPRLITLE